MLSASIYGLMPRKNFSLSFSLFIIPCLFLILGLYNLSVQGPFYSFQNIDPSYAYLFNGFELLHFHAPGHVDHPGTTTQLFMAIVMGLKWLFTASSCWLSNQPVPSLDHLFYTQPETFLYAGAISLILVNALLFSWVSFKLWLLAKKQAVIFAFQLGLFLFFPTIESFSMFTPEPMLLTSILLLCLAIFPVLIKNDTSDAKYAGYFGLALGFGMATKVTFLPLALLLFLYPSTQRKKLIKWAFISFLIFTFPIWGRYLKMVKWLVKLAFHQGHYGTGELGLVDSTKVIDNLKLLIHTIPFLFVSLVGVCGYLLSTYKKNSPLIKKFLFLTLGVLLFSLALNLKHPGVRYIIPILLFCGPVAGIIAYQLLQQKPRYIIGLFTVLFLGLGLTGLQYQTWHQQRIVEANGHASFDAYVKTNQCKVVGYYHPSLQSYAMFFGNQWAWKKRTPVLDQYYPKSIFFEPERELFFDFHGPNHYLLDKADVEQEFKQHACVVFKGMKLSLPVESIYNTRVSHKSLDNYQSTSGQFYELSLS